MSRHAPMLDAMEAIDAVAIGTSAGGVEALSRLLPALPAGLRASVFIVIHLPRERPSLLVDVFTPKCLLPVHEAADKEPVQPGTVYFAPPDYHLLIDLYPRIGKQPVPQLALSADAPVHFSRPSIDVLFETAADVYRERLLAIVLTGGNADGAAGLAAVLAAGGLAVVQQPSDAAAPAMPASAIQRSPTSAVMPLGHIASMLHALPTNVRPDVAKP